LGRWCGLSLLEAVLFAHQRVKYSYLLLQLAATLEAQSYIEEERIAEAFDRLDSDDSGYISKKNLRQFLGNNATSKQIDDIIREGDANGDGKRK
jgi:Ca2+-binding EF-hand superfamily protein